MNTKRNLATRYGGGMLSRLGGDNAPQRAAVFARLASSQQNAISDLNGQVFSCRKYAQELGVEVVRVYKHVGVSGAGAWRPDLEELLRDATARKFEILILEDLDRLSRNAAEVIDMVGKLEELAIPVCTVGRGYVTSLNAVLVMKYAAAQVNARAAVQAARGGRKFKSRRHLPPIAGGDGG